MTRIPSVNGKEITNVAGAARARKSGAPTVEDIRARAYELYVARGAVAGHEVEDWVQAERDLRSQVTVVTR